MQVYDWLIAIAGSSDAHHIQIDLDTKTLLYKSSAILKDGALEVASAPMPDGFAVPLVSLIDFPSDPYAEIESLYAQFKRSVPSKQDRLNKGNFKAQSSDQLTYEELESNLPRMEARLRLEGFILLAASAGLLQWEVPRHFYWQGADPDLILYRKWVMKEDNQ